MALDKVQSKKIFQTWYAKARGEYESTQSRLDDWLAARADQIQALKTMSQQTLAAASLAGAIALNTPTAIPKLEQVQAQTASQSVQTVQSGLETDELQKMSEEEFNAIMEKLSEAVAQPPGHLPKSDELYVEQQLSDILGFPVSAELEGNRLNHSLGIMGGEQHLKRFPGDSLEQHDAYIESGIAPNRGAFGWFTEQGQLTPDAIQREKYYFAVQTLYLPNWNTEHPRLKEWYKFRKMIVINPTDRMAVVGVVGDAGPALWVKKQYGGSPEIIREGKIWSRTARGRVMLLFVDDPGNTIPLGPIQLQAPAVER